MKYCRFPVGPPRDVPAIDIKVPMTAPEDLTFSGFMLCRVLAPDDLRLPLIAEKSCGKLVFGLCKSKYFLQVPQNYIFLQSV